ncbi:bifunctional 4-hydroxy-2-oxoglutarate aldolase/2-dehydro-3-deoxy-phosphogluconate aldolase [Brevibacterium album]|uniref:bifunctional 4-hydroxy-2-oxoglutarate aldolase/2-dehydro-3-deoxy-phosphogluconate aldolase n=1 Tax=Brevibacterium album TaxID=417948 RepID=UPI0003F610D0|nr:bifunctional 4-hydroxy-2-oxoglutarate aldolase/2-dehydro-3-deoxy-phosphogluconate aldolase [Brevibacterium album]
MSQHSDPPSNAPQPHAAAQPHPAAHQRPAAQAPQAAGDAASSSPERSAVPARPELPARTRASRLIAVMRAKRAEDYAPVIEVLAAAGVRSFELTLTTPGTFEALPGLVERFGAEADLGVGTVTTPEQVDLAAAAGAHYLVTPVSVLPVVDRAVERGIPVIPGGLTPTELHSTWSRGAAAVKVFPAGVVGAGYVKDLRGPFPGMRVVPSGGVDFEAAEAWLAAGAEAVSVGGPLLGDAFAGGDLDALAERARRFVAACAQDADAAGAQA